MKLSKYTIRKTVFTIIFVLAMFIVESKLSTGLRLGHNLSLTLVLSSSLWAFIASNIFDGYYKKRNTEQMSNKVLENLKEIKELLNK